MGALLIAAVSAVVDWWAVATDRPPVERIAKPTVMIGLLAALIIESDAESRVVLATAVVLSLVGDVLLLPAIDRFTYGLAAFLLAHIAYIAAFVLSDVRTVLIIAGSIVGLVAVAIVGRPIIAGAAREGSALARAVALYVVVLAAMVATAVGTGEPLLVAGALIFGASDGVLGWHRFVMPIGHGRLVTHALYHVGQGSIVLWAIS